MLVGYLAASVLALMAGAPLFWLPEAIQVFTEDVMISESFSPTHVAVSPPGSLSTRRQGRVGFRGSSFGFWQTPAFVVALRR